MLSMERAGDELFLVGNVQPSMSWSKAHLVYFRFSRERLTFTWCRCRNG